MTQKSFHLIENHMLSAMADSAHDAQHVYRVLYNALEIAESETGVNYDVLITACLLHDIGRKEQFEDPKLCHAAVGSKKARIFLAGHNFSEEFTERVCHCILSHRFRKAAPPQTIEAKILFDADKLDVTGVIGIARTLLYQGKMESPLYTLLPDGTVSDGSGEPAESFFGEYKFKLEKLYGTFLTEAGAQLAQQRRTAAESFYKSLYAECARGYEAGPLFLQRFLD